jgi:cobalt-zinc-cadmium efflux system protein
MSNHHHHSGNDHHHNSAFKLGVILNLAFIIFEVFFAFQSNSSALLADAGHNLSDVLALIFSWIAVVLSHKKPTLKYTYGYRRSSILIAIVNTLLLIVAIGLVSWDAIVKLGVKSEVHSHTVIIIASMGIFVNGFTAWLFSRDHENNDLNIKSTFQHFLADALVSFGVVVSGFLIIWTGQIWIDSVVTLLIVFIIAYNSYHLLIDSINLALDAVPQNIDIDKVKIYLMSIPQVTEVHDLHVWALSTSQTALTAHLCTDTSTNVQFLSDIQTELKKIFNIEHSTLQIEFGKCSMPCANCCN